MKLLNEYFKLQGEIYKYFGYVEDWCRIPLSDETKYHWMLVQNEDGSGRVHYAETADDVDEDDATYTADIYTQRFLPKWVYRGESYTMVCADTQCDGNKFLMVFDNAKEIK